MIYFCILMLFLMGIINYLYQRDGMSPVVIQPLLWSFLLIGADSMQQSFFTLSSETLFLCASGSLLFSAGFWFSRKMAPRTGRHATMVNEKYSLRYRNLLFVIVLVVLPFYIQVANFLAISGPGDDLATNLRYSLSEGQVEGEGFGILGYGVTLSLFLLLLESFFYSRKSKWRLIAATLIALVFCVLSTGRTFILTLLIYLLFPLMLNKKLRFGRGALLMSGMFLSAFYIYSATLGKDGGGDWDAMLDVFSVYLYGGLFAFDKLAHTLAQYDHGGNLFRSFYAVAHTFDSSAKVMSMIEEYQYLPAATNVYTIFGKAFRDFGYAGVAIYMFLIGILHGHLYFGAKRGSVYYNILFVISFYPLLMQFFQDQYMGLLSTWVQILVLTLLFMISTRCRRAPTSSPLSVPL